MLMPEVSRIKDKYYISATSSILDPSMLIVKDGDIFGVFNRFGDILPVGRNEQGLYLGGTRFLSLCELRINGLRPLFLSSNVDEDDILLTIDLTNPDLYAKGRLLIAKDSLHIMRSKILYDMQDLEYIRIKNFGRKTVSISLDFLIDADFRDIFEVRGLKRERNGKRCPIRYADNEMELSYEGLDGVMRKTEIISSVKPESVRNKTFSFLITLQPGSAKEIFFTVTCSMNDKGSRRTDFREALKKSRNRLREKNKSSAVIETSNEQFNESVKRSLADINMMLTETGDGIYPYGGIPWFCTPFGRDGIITALETMWIKPGLAKGVLSYLAARQAKSIDASRAAEPGKILHEVRKGELAALGEIPFGLYYGSVDSTPLFIMLAGAYWRRTGDTGFIRNIWDNIRHALRWMKDYGDVDGDGFLEYVPDIRGLRNQGWKDSHDSVFHNDGSLAEGPIALCEVQCYQYAAKKEAAILAKVMGKEGLSQKLLKEAEELKEKFNNIFWDEEMGTYVLALDGLKKPCRVVSSNAGQVLFTGIAEPDKALKVAETLTSEAVFSGWGIRTVSEHEALYNPMSYHNGSVWPHDNALIAYGFSSCGLKEHFLKVFSGIFDASLFMEFQRLPELFCGFQRRKGASPTLYPVACMPQTWASGSLLLMLQASLGLDFESDRERVIFRQPVLPEFLNRVVLKNLSVTGKKSVDLFIRRYGEDVTVEVLKKPEGVSVMVIK
ncbi:MAG TPA: amylo-alpha-1,6-glucosidase [Nitrospirae bacterium]|nr:amylo-alpha-1,6-glucosidase [Nitrospirota bacterium]HDZ02478.1 amylo-alpha-1,6-glucosidase [Nitrospirota bacterium]